MTTHTVTDVKPKKPTLKERVRKHKATIAVAAVTAAAYIGARAGAASRNYQVDLTVTPAEDVDTTSTEE